jgi:hypothetical protein
MTCGNSPTSCWTEQAEQIASWLDGCKSAVPESVALEVTGRITQHSAMSTETFP